MKSIIPILTLVGSSLFGQVTPNLPHNTPHWATTNDLHVAYVIMGEAEGESKLGKALVADVIYERMIKKNLTAFEVVIEPYQFVGYRETEPTKFIWNLVKKLKHKQDIIKQADFTQFRAIQISPVPSWGKNPTIVGNHCFFNE